MTPEMAVERCEIAMDVYRKVALLLAFGGPSSFSDFVEYHYCMKRLERYKRARRRLMRELWEVTTA